MPGWELVGKEERDAINEIFDLGGVFHRYAYPQLRHGVYRVEQFEKTLAEKLGVRHALCVSSGTAALKLALMGAGVGAGDEVITQSFTFVATLEAILELGAKPVITEVDATLNMDPSDLERKITPRTKAIVPVHMAGVPAKMDEILAIAGKNHIAVIEDAAQALGATYKGKFAGTLSDAGIFSLDYAKIINTGDGGILVTDKEDIFLRAREYSDHGHEYNPSLPRGKDTRKTWGFNYKMTELQGAIGLVQLKKLDYILQKQKENKQAVKRGIAGLNNIEFRAHADDTGDAGDTLIFFLKNPEKANKFAILLAQAGFGTKNLPDAIDWHFAGTWTHIFSAFPEYKGKNLEDFWMKSAGLLRRAVSLPIYVKMDQTSVQKLVDAIIQTSAEVEK